MSERDSLERLRRLTGRAVAESARKEAALRRGPPRSSRPGDIYVLGEDPDSPVEWVVLTGDAEPHRLLAVPADTNPMAGSRDLALDDPSAGPLVLRLGLATDLTASVFEPAARRGALEPESLKLALHAYGEVESDEPLGTVRQREMDVDPAYEDWIRDHVEPARQALMAAAAGSAGTEEVLAFPEQPVTRPKEPTGRMVPARWIYALAAALVLVTVGLSSWIVSQQRQLDRFSRPSFNLPSAEIRLNDVARGAEPIAVPGDATHLLLYLFLAEPEPCESYELRLLGRGNREVFARTLAEWPLEDVTLVLPLSVLDLVPLTLRLHGTCAGKQKLLDERELWITLDR